MVARERRVAGSERRLPRGREDLREKEDLPRRVREAVYPSTTPPDDAPEAEGQADEEEAEEDGRGAEGEQENHGES